MRSDNDVVIVPVCGMSKSAKLHAMMGINTMKCEGKILEISYDLL